MKNLLLSFILAVVPLFGYAEGKSLVFTTSDGVSHSIAAAGLNISFEDGMMNASNGSESLSLSVASLSSMYFGVSSGVAIAPVSSDSPVSVISPSGLRLGDFRSMDEAKTQLPGGMYIVRTSEGKTVKIVVEK